MGKIKESDNDDNDEDEDEDNRNSGSSCSDSDESLYGLSTTKKKARRDDPRISALFNEPRDDDTGGQDNDALRDTRRVTSLSSDEEEW